MKRLTTSWPILVMAFLGICTIALGAPKPNILFILADDLGYGDLGCYGCPDIRTPHLDRLAQEGVRFTQFYANGSVCSPTRAAFMSGRYQQRLGLEDAVTYQEFGRGLPEDGETLADALKAAGYNTGLIGKWHLGYDLERRPLQQGFDHFFGFLGGNHHYFQHMDRIGVPDLWLGNEAIARQGYTTDLLTEDAKAFLAKPREQPFFLYLAHAAPHFPWQGPTDENKLVEPKKPSWQEGDRQTYIAMVERLDHGIGQVLAKLDELGLRENTLVVFSSDNGGHTYSRNAPMRDFKGTIWEGGVRVPCIARWPGVIPAGTTSAQMGITMDWTATFRRLAGLGPDAQHEDGVDVMPFLTQKAPSQTRTLFWRLTNRRPKKQVEEGRSVCQGPWKLIEYATGERYLFNLTDDVGEQQNLIQHHPDLVQELHQKLDAWEKDIAASTPN
ncbi:Sulfatase [Prosthecobacter debontii]|uniref:Sulfatase n=1 Tax=Prosthecobacter debontii TaxID=48467 RepID=A0A1T4YGD8_9BACT|nr:sulfatase [Prosthecobacter debontii]SKB00887.1 Sulfatase [Prosthecobacter debontii]